MEEPVKIESVKVQTRPEKINHKYGFIITHLTKDLKIHYFITIKFIKYSRTSIPIYEINRSQVYINDRAPDLVLYEMADKMAKSMYPFEISINANNEIVTIENYEEIFNRCKQTEKELRQYYVGDTTEKMIDNFNSHYKDVDYLRNELQNNIFFRILFFPSQKQLNLRFNQQTEFNCKVGENEIKLPVFQEIEPLYSNSKKIKMNVLGLQNIFDVSAFKINYKLYDSDYAIFAATGKIAYEIKREKTAFEFECYHVNE